MGDSREFAHAHVCIYLHIPLSIGDYYVIFRVRPIAVARHLLQVDHMSETHWYASTCDHTNPQIFSVAITLFHKSLLLREREINRKREREREGERRRERDRERKKEGEREKER